MTEITLPVRAEKSAFRKFALRKAIDFAIVNCAVAESDDGVTVVLGGVYPAPVVCTQAGEILSGGVNDKHRRRRRATPPWPHAKPLANNAYKVEIARTLVKRTALDVASA